MLLFNIYVYVNSMGKLAYVDEIINKTLWITLRIENGNCIGLWGIHEVFTSYPQSIHDVIHKVFIILWP